MSGKLNLMKLCVGCASPEELAAWQASRYGHGPAEHTTRMWPKREAELLDGGSIYWVFKGLMLARQPLVGLEERIGQDGIRRCVLKIGREMIPVAATPRRAFQGWRYLDAADAPPDLSPARAHDDSLPPEIARELAEFGLR
ncbi:MAG: DUF1489 domain-containing protein [Paracoccus sp. (in: a-proteobacteria)]|uniref:DUF1489 family protein n=1 Tax=Paracoccus sp. TaxID=267 RepID=UPI0026E0491E|nr:DUF1489 domain-containing protein [Paracoccus sp. (in: a-proteobacteria)]MDO5620408.1 DUF1489 domain-containing protein [Paracoccus sp. (in: a-proteobacteria)]